MKTLLVALPGNEEMCRRLVAPMRAERADAVFHRFPDGETYVRFESDVRGATVWLVCTLDRPDPKFIPLMIAAETARDLGAGRVGLIAPYLAYMRQDARFRPGEAVSSAYFARVLSCVVDALVTVDPHLHRRSSLAEIYSIPTAVVHASRTVAAWLRDNVDRPVIVGPDAESEQWVADVAAQAGAPHIVLAKVRRGDRDVQVSVPDVAMWTGYTPVLVDDIVSTARTMIETVGHLRAAQMTPPVCIAVHAIFADDAYTSLLKAGASRVVTTDTITHKSNAINLTTQVAAAAASLSWPGRSCCADSLDGDG